MKTKNIFVAMVLFLAGQFTVAGHAAEINLQVNGPFTQQVQSMVDASSCAKYSWKSRGRAPAGYIRGMSLDFARALCRYKVSNGQAGLIKIQSSADRNNSAKDAVTHYRSIFRAAGIDITTSGESMLSALYTLGIGLGMRDSSGDYCEGWDTSAGRNRPSNEGEAGLFQFSYNSIAASVELKNLYAEYQAHPEKCMLDVFKVGASCRPQNVLGTGAGAAFQAFTKSCPAFAGEYAMTLVRLLRAHFGPINRREAEVKPQCYDMLRDVEELLEANPNQACAELL